MSALLPELMKFADVVRQITEYAWTEVGKVASRFNDTQLRSETDEMKTAGDLFVATMNNNAGRVTAQDYQTLVGIFGLLLGEAKALASSNSTAGRPSVNAT